MSAEYVVGTRAGSVDDGLEQALAKHPGRWLEETLRGAHAARAKLGARTTGWWTDWLDATDEIWRRMFVQDPRRK